MMQLVEKHFQSLSDPRSLRNQRHPFSSLIALSFIGILSGIETFSGLGDFAQAYEEELKEFIPMPFGAPSHDTFQRIWEAIDPKAFKACFSLFIQSLEPFLKPKKDYSLLCLDGKTVRNSGDHPLHVVSAWCQEHGLVLAQEVQKGKGKELVALRTLLETLDLAGKIVTVDALGCQRDVCNKIVERGGDYLIALKGNQGTLLREVQEFFAAKNLLESCFMWYEADKGHGRLEERTTYVTEDIDWLKSSLSWPGLCSIGMVRRQRTNLKTGKETEEKKYYISSLPAHAELFHQTARRHWSIENELHWRLDVLFGEDKACIRLERACENMALLRKWALNILQLGKEKPDQSLASVQRKARSFSYLLRLLRKVLGGENFHA